MAVIDFNLQAPDENAPRVLWRNVPYDQQPGGVYDTIRDPMTWNDATIAASATLTLDSPVACNAIAVAGGNWSGQSIMVDYNDGAGWTQAGVWQPTPGAPFMALFDFQTADQWRVRVTGTLTASVVRLGMALAMQRNVWSGIQPITKRVNKTPNVQLGAHYSGAQIRQTRRESGTLSFNKLTPDWVRAYWSEFMTAHRHVGVFVAWRPDAYRNEVVYGMTGDDVSAMNESGNGMMRTQFELEGVER